VDLAAVHEDDPGAIAGHDAIVEAEEDPEVTIGPRGAIDGHAEGPVGRQPGGVAPVPVLVRRLARVVEDDDALPLRPDRSLEGAAGTMPDAG
jgi:hypothetical protein